MLECAQRREKETQIFTTHRKYMRKRIVQLTKHQLKKIYKHVNWWIIWKWMGPLIDENKLKGYLKDQQIWKAWKIFWKQIISKNLRLFALNWTQWIKALIQLSIRSLRDWTAFYCSLKMNKNQKMGKNSKFNKNWTRKVSKPLKNFLHRWKFFCFQKTKEMGFFCLTVWNICLTINWTYMNKYTFYE